MGVCADSAPFELGDELVDRRSILVSGHDHRVHLEVIAPEFVDKPHDLQVVGDAEVLPRLALDDVARIDADDDLGLVLHPLEQLDLGVLVEARQHSHRVLVLYQLASELKVQTALAAAYPFKDVLGLFFDVLFCAESFFNHVAPNRSFFF